MYPTRDLSRPKLSLHATNINLHLTENGCTSFAFQKPVTLGCFSLDSERRYVPNASQLRYYKPPQISSVGGSIDLNEGSGLAKTKPWPSSEGLNHLLQFIFDNRKKGMLLQQKDATNFVLDAEFVCFRGLLSLLMHTPYEKRETWYIHVTRFRGTFYMWRPDIHESCEINMMRSRRLGSIGNKFKQYCLSTSPLVEPDTQSPVDESAEFFRVLKTQINGNSIIYCAEMEGIISEHPVDIEQGELKWDQLKFIHLKMRNQHMYGGQIITYERHKTREWWCQSFLAGVQDIYVGLRTPNGILKDIEHKRTSELPKIGEEFWSPGKCFNFLTHFLENLRTIMVEIDCPHTVFAFHFQNEIDRIGYERLSGVNMHSFLPDWYIEMFG